MSLKSRGEWILPEGKIEGDILNYLLKKRGIEDVEGYLSPSLKDIPSSSKLYDSQRAAKEILSSVKNGEKIIIHGDFDSDGICASSILWEFLYRDLATFLGQKIDIIPYIPSRIEEGYGLTEDSLNSVLELGGKLLISVDCGVRDEQLIKKYMKGSKGKQPLKIVVTDHHQPPEDLSEDLEYPLVHQMYPNHEYPYTQICGTAVAFLLIQEIKKQVGMDFELTPETKGLDLVAMATITDIMPLVGINRIFVKYGLEQIRKRSRKGLNHLCLRAGINPEDVNSYHLGYVLGPRINAAGRIGSPLDAVKLLVSNDDKLCQDIAEELEKLNFERQQLTTNTKEEALVLIGDVSKNNAIFVLGSEWHDGIIGLVAGKLQEEYHRPVIVATENRDSVKGSARSISGFNITEALGELSKYLERYGGHELAAGFTAKKDLVNEFKEEFIKFANKQIKKEQLIVRTEVDLVLNTSNITKRLIEQLSLLEPLGFKNPKPIICLQDLVIVTKTVMGTEKNHLKLLVKGDGIDLLQLVLFNVEDDIDVLEKDTVIDVIGYPDINVWNNVESIQFKVKEWRFTEEN